MTNTLEIPAWANGPDDSANGGFAAGLIADSVDAVGAIEINLRLPPPLATELLVERTDSGWQVDDPQGNVVAQACATELDDLEIAPMWREVTPERARSASSAFPYADQHPFPRCLCCGTERDAGLPALRIHCGRIDDTDVFADAWTPTHDLADPALRNWATRAAGFSALDCPSAAPFAHPDRPAVLARYEVRLDARPRIGETYVLLAWELDRDGRKLTSASALVDWSADEPTIIGRARALWIEVRRP